MLFSYHFKYVFCLTVAIIFMFANLSLAKEDIKPTIDPAIFTFETEITVTYDVTGNTLANLSDAWIWVWIPNKSIDAKYNINPASDNRTLTDNAKFTKSTANNKTTFSITFTPKDFFDGDISKETNLGMLLKGNDWANGQTTDYIADLSEDKFTALLTKPELNPAFLSTGETLEITSISNEPADFVLTINGVDVNTQNNISDYSYTHTATETGGIIPCALHVSSIASVEDTIFSFNYMIRTSTVEQPRPAGIISGINYDNGDDTKVTLCLLAPMKSSVFVVGDFNNYSISPEYQMYKDAEYFWLEITGLTAGKEYAFQYLVDESVYVADPYADKILDPDDKWIPTTIYPDLKTFPEEAIKTNGTSIDYPSFKQDSRITHGKMITIQDREKMTLSYMSY